MENSIINLLKEKLSALINVDNINIKKIYEVIFDIFSETNSEYLIRRHKELKKNGYKNKEIYFILKNEIQEYLFRSNKLSERQIKRIVYKE